LGGDTVVRESEIIGLFDIENTSVNRQTREFLKDSEKKGRVFNVSFDMPKSFILCSDGDRETLFISHTAAAVLKKRVVTRKKSL
jgi:hypothetical protein